MVIWSQRDGVWSSMPLAAPLAPFADPFAARLVPFAQHGAPRAALVARAGTGLMLNGLPPLAVSVLRHRDEIVLGGSRLVFSAFAATELAPFVADAPGTRCARCKAVLVAGELVLRCGACGAPHHEHGELLCASYDVRCGGCDRRRDDVAWTPACDDEELCDGSR